MRLIENINYNVAEDKIMAALQYKMKASQSIRMLKKVLFMIEKTKKIIQPKIIYTVKNIESKDKQDITLENEISFSLGNLHKTFNHSNSLTVFIATLGIELDKEINRYVQNHKLLDGYLLDFIGSYIIEQIVEGFQRSMDKDIKSLGQKTTRRFSPGYCSWKLGQQKNIFATVEGQRIGVQLSPGNLMVPKKSISGIFGVIEEDQISYNPCLHCKKQNCDYKRI
jgi:hypothetical protein